MAFTTAEKVLADYQLVPRALPSGPSPHSESSAAAGQERLVALHAHIKAELLEILPALGHPVR